MVKKSSSRNLTPSFDGLGSRFPLLEAMKINTPTTASLPSLQLLGNSGYGKAVANVDGHRDVKYCTGIGNSALINSKRFRQPDVITKEAYEIEMKKGVVKYTLPLHTCFFVY